MAPLSSYPAAMAEVSSVADAPETLVYDFRVWWRASLFTERSGMDTRV